MNVYILVIALYLAGLTVMNFWKSRQVRSQDDMMVAGRSLSVGKMVFTLVCTWIGSGTFIAGAEFAAKAGWSAMWQPAGAYLGILVIYFLAAKIRTFGQYTVGDILEVRYGALARVVGAVAIFISFTTIVSYQFRAGGYILNVISGGSISVGQGQFMAALFVILFTVIGGMIAVANTDLPNGIIIVSSTILSTPLVIWAAGGWDRIKSILPSSHFQVISSQFGGNPYLKIPAIALIFDHPLHSPGHLGGRRLGQDQVDPALIPFSGDQFAVRRQSLPEDPGDCPVDLPAFDGRAKHVSEILLGQDAPGRQEGGRALADRNRRRRIGGHRHGGVCQRPFLE